MPIVKSISTVDGEEVSLLVEVDNLPGEKSPYDNTRAGGVVIPETARDLFEDGLGIGKNLRETGGRGD